MRPLDGGSWSERAPLFVFLAYGGSPALARELRYGLETLLPEIGGEASRVIVYTDHPQDFADLAIVVVDASPLLAEALAHPYRHRAKPRALADALRRFRRPCVLLDTDGFVRPGFAGEIERALARARR